MLEAAASIQDARARARHGRVEAAKAAAPYVHPKMPRAVVVAPEAKIEKVTVEIVGVPQRAAPGDR